MKIIMPCCGNSTRYPNLPPKWILPASNGEPMIKCAMSEIEYSESDLVITILKEHDIKYGISNGLRKAFSKNIEIIILENSTHSQSETVAKTLEMLKTDGSIFIKDSDNSFKFHNLNRDYNYICVDSLNNYDEINPRNKSYVQVDQKGIVCNIREKRVISDTFNVGGYYFTNSAEFLSNYRMLESRNHSKNIYISDVIGYMILNKKIFYTEKIDNYYDWGTVFEWKKFLKRNRTIFVNVDGFIFEHGSEYFKPDYADVKANKNVVNTLLSLSNSGNKLIYLSNRKFKYYDLTFKQISYLGLPESQIIMDCPTSPWMMLGAPHPIFPISSLTALEIKPENYEDLENLKCN